MPRLRLTKGRRRTTQFCAKIIVPTLASPEAEVCIPIKAEIAEAEQAKAHTVLVIGRRDMDVGAASVRLHGKGPQGAKPRSGVVVDILQAINERRS